MSASWVDGTVKGYGMKCFIKSKRGAGKLQSTAYEPNLTCCLFLQIKFHWTQPY